MLPESKIILLLIWVASFHASPGNHSSVESADLLQNGDFETPPANITVNDTNQRALLSTSNALPGWQFGGTVEYIKAGGNISLPGNGHALQLGQDGWISQRFISKAMSFYLLTFTLAEPGEDCSPSSYLNISADLQQSSLFSLQRRFGDESWETHAWGFQATHALTNLTFRSQPQEKDRNITCGAVVDALLLKDLGNLSHLTGTLLFNGNFELGPYSLPNSSLGVLLQAADGAAASSLPGWTVTGTVKYIDSNHFRVPQGNGAVEIVSGPGGGIGQSVKLPDGASYALKFNIGDANDSCLGNMTVGVRAGSTAKNFTHISYGMGESMNFLMAFVAASEPTNISFSSLGLRETKDLEFCGPVIDNVLLMPINGSARLPNYLPMVAFLLSFLAIRPFLSQS